MTKAVFKVRTNKRTVNDRINGFANEEENIIDLGLPIITLNNDDFKKENETSLNDKKDLLKEAIRMEQFNIGLFQQGVPYFVWFEQIITNKSVKKAWCVHAGWGHITQINDSLYPNLVTLMLSFDRILKANPQNHDAKRAIEALREVLNLFPKDRIAPELKRDRPDLF